MKRQYVLDVLKLIFLYGLIWLILSNGVFNILIAILLLIFAFITPFLFDLHRQHFSLIHALQLFIVFVYYSIKSGIVVAFYALHPKLKLHPIIYEFKFQTTTPFATSLLANIYSLMPGTLSMGIEKEHIVLHLLDDKLLDTSFMDTIQQKVIDAFELQNKVKA
jgi:multicomponent Na+:H+ antiporter subunit E